MDDPTQQIIYELLAQTAEHMARGEPIPPALAARTYRLLRELEPPQTDKAEEVRALLHGEASAGNARAAETLELLSDDPWWRESP